MIIEITDNKPDAFECVQHVFPFHTLAVVALPSLNSKMKSRNKLKKLA